MTDPSPATDEFTLRCERCGYVIEGLPVESTCPECNRPIALSLPEHRIGTPWQQRRTPRSLIYTWWRTARHPYRTMDTLRLDEIRLFGMVLPTLLLCGTSCWLIVCLLDILTTKRLLGLAIAIPFYAAVVIILASTLFMISGAVALGLQAYSRWRGTRVSPDTAWHIIGFASIGWALTWSMWLAGWTTVRVWRIIDPPLTDLEHRQRTHFEFTSILFPAFVGGFAAGVILFLGYSFLGLRRLKHANRVRPPGQTPADPVVSAPPAAH